MAVVAGGSALRWVLFGAGIAFMVGGPRDTWKVPVAETVAVGGMTVFYAVMFRVRFGAGRTGVPSPRVGTLLRETLPIGASELTWALRVYFATVALGVLVGGPELGWFGGAHRIVLALHTFVWLYFFNVLPSMARTSTRPRGELSELIGGSLRASAWVAVFVGAVVTALAEPIVTVLYGSAYEASAPVLRILVWLVPVAMVSGHYRYILIGYGHQTLEFGAAAVGAAVAAIVAVLTIRPLGTPGVAAGLVASELAVCAVAYGFVCRKVTWIPLIRQIWKPAAAGAGLAAVLAVWPPQFGWSIAVVATIAYWSWAGVVERGEIRELLTKCRAAARPRVV
jgi:O-antigen/teichoic acid export membrane protein